MHLLLKSAKHLIQTLRKWVDTEFVFPIITDLWRILTGEPLSFTGVISFVLAIPVTFLSKILTGRGPPDLSGLTKHSWDSYSVHSSKSVSFMDMTEMAYFGRLTANVCEDAEDLASGWSVLTKSVKSAMLFDIVANVNLFDLIMLVVKFGMKVPPYSPAWKEERKKTEHIIVSSSLLAQNWRAETSQFL